jgi:glycosyltransferase involved in cell wall biosynthesis
VRKVLFVGDYACTTGFSTVNTALLRAIKTIDPSWVPYILGINASGDPHIIREEFPYIYPASVEPSHDVLGIRRLPALVDAIKPNLLFIHSDPWLVPIYLQALAQAEVTQPPTVAWCCPDSPHQPSGAKIAAYGVQHLITPTAFGRDELVAGGWDGPSSVISYGVNTDLFTPGDDLGGCRAARMRVNVPEKWLDAFVVGRGDRNAERKNYPCSLEGFALAWRTLGCPEDFVFHAHCQPVSNQGWDLPDLASYYGIAGQIMFTGAGHREGRGVPDRLMPDIYRSWQQGVHLSTSKGEGQGLIAFESAACGVAQVLVNESAYKELFADAAHFLPKRWTDVTPGGINTRGAVTAPEDVAGALVDLYRDDVYRADMAAVALTVPQDARYRWTTVAERMLEVWNEVGRG